VCWRSHQRDSMHKPRARRESMLLICGNKSDAPSSSE
jgi:hypothetical protein